MKELQDLADTLREDLAEKEKELLATGTLSVTAQSLLQNRARDISFFEARIKEVSSDPTLRNTIISNFTTIASEIEDQIKSIS